MSISQYFNHSKNTSEQNLFEDMVVETIKLSGIDVYYIVADREEVDPILSETVRTMFREMMTIEAFMPGGGQQSGEGELMAKFGYVQRETLALVMAKRRFREEAALGNLSLLRPREGDLIFVGDIDVPYASQVNELYEITHVDFYEAVWSFGKTFAWKIELSAFTFSHENFDTGTVLDGAMVDFTAGDLDNAINEAVKSTKQTLLSFDKNNPLGNL